MKYLLITVLFISSITFTSCKKSDSDPLLPFSTRDARITNTWELVKQNKTVTEVNPLGIKDIKKYSFDGTKMSYYHKDIWNAETNKEYAYSDVMTISKGNLFSQTISNDGEITKTNSFWYWHDATKNKTGISFDTGKTYLIKRLAKKELILESSRIVTVTNDGKTTTIENSEVLTYNAK